MKKIKMKTDKLILMTFSCLAMYVVECLLLVDDDLIINALNSKPVALSVYVIKFN